MAVVAGSVAWAEWQTVQPGSRWCRKQPAMPRAGKRLGRGCMALGARLGNVLRTGGGKRVVNRADVVDAVAIHALGRPPAAGGQHLAVNARLVLGKLVHGQLRVVFAHEIGVAVTAPAEFRDALARDPDLEAAARVHRDVLVAFVGIAAVTIGATDRVGEMDVVGELQAHPFHDAVTIKAGILAGTGSAAQQGISATSSIGIFMEFDSSIASAILFCKMAAPG